MSHRCPRLNTSGSPGYGAKGSDKSDTGFQWTQEKPIFSYNLRKPKNDHWFCSWITASVSKEVFLRNIMTESWHLTFWIWIYRIFPWTLTSRKRRILSWLRARGFGNGGFQSAGYSRVPSVWGLTRTQNTTTLYAADASARAVWRALISMAAQLSFSWVYGCLNVSTALCVAPPES